MNRHELELLADHAAGVLDDTPAGAAVAHLIATDPGWAAAHAELVAADSTVRNALTNLRPVTMPAAVAAQLDTALAAEDPPGAAPASAPGGSRGGAVVPLRARRRRAWQAGGAVAAGIALLAAGALGWQVLVGTASRDAGTETAAAPASSQAGPEAFAQDNAAKATGGDYTRAGLPDQVRRLVARPTLREGLGRTDVRPAPAAPDANPANLDRLRDPAALAACVRALRLAAAPLATDYGRYEGSPALVIVVGGDDPGTVTAVVVGPACGLTGPDERRRTMVIR